MFTSASEMPESIRAHLRYPEDMFRLQAEQYLRYHIRDPRTFFIGEDLWAVPTEKFRQQEQPLEPYYVIMKLPGEEIEEFSLILPFTPRNKQNTIAWLAGRSDGDNLRQAAAPTASRPTTSSSVRRRSRRASTRIRASPRSSRSGRAQAPR